jgi:CRP-like cAMP-binding protein
MLLSDFKAIFSISTTPKIRRYKANEFVFRQGNPAHYVFAVVEGQVKLERSTIEGRTALMHTIQAGDSFAEAALFSDVYHCNAITTKPSEVIQFPKEEVLKVLCDNPQMALKYISHLSSQVRNLRTRLELSNILSARERILQFILVYIDHEKREIVLKGTLKDFAAELGLAHETLYRELKTLEKEGIIERNGSRIIIRDLY